VNASRPVLWGVLNVTPDSFSDGGKFLSQDLAVAHAASLVEQGAAVIDVGGESTKPGAQRVAPEVEQERVIPVIQALAKLGYVLSIDTMNASTASAAIAAGATIVNDVSGGLADPDMFATVAPSGVDYVMMHWRGHSDVMDDLARYRDVASEVRSELQERVALAMEAGISPNRIILDPGVGFAKTPAHNWALLSRIDEVTSMGHRVLVGASRKRFLGELLPEGHAMTERDEPSAVLGVLLAERGVWGLRVHNPLIHTRALDVWQALSEGSAQ
jgi:dihydropteroate synthase